MHRQVLNNLIRVSLLCLALGSVSSCASVQEVRLAVPDEASAASFDRWGSSLGDSSPYTSEYTVRYVYDGTHKTYNVTMTDWDFPLPDKAHQIYFDSFSTPEKFSMSVTFNWGSQSPEDGERLFSTLQKQIDAETSAANPIKRIGSEYSLVGLLRLNNACTYEAILQKQVAVRYYVFLTFSTTSAGGEATCTKPTI
jgi:hypothetical protein